MVHDLLRVWKSGGGIEGWFWIASYRDRERFVRYLKKNGKGYEIRVSSCTSERKVKIDCCVSK